MKTPLEMLDEIALGAAVIRAHSLAFEGHVWDDGCEACAEWTRKTEPDGSPAAEAGLCGVGRAIMLSARRRLKETQ